MGGFIRGNDDDIIELVIRDYSGAKRSTWRFPAKDEKSFNKVVKSIQEKYGSGVSDKDIFSVDSEILSF